MKAKRTKRKNKYRELRAAIAAIRRNNGALLAVLPQWPEEWGRRRDGSTDGGMVKETVAAFFRERGKAAVGDVAAFLDAMAKFSFDEFPRDWPELWRMVYSAREIQWRLRRHFPGNAFFDRVFHEELAFFKAVLPTAREERARAYWELLRRVAGFSRRVLARFSENTVRSLEGEKFQAVCLAEIGDGVLRKIACAIGNRDQGTGNMGRAGEPWPCGHGAGRTGGTAARTRRSGTDGEGRRGPQTAFMAKQRKVFLEYLKVHPETASVSRITRARECWAIHRKEWDAAAKKGIGYADYKALSRAKLM